MKLALVYDRINKFGGAERVLQVLHRMWPKAPLFTSVYHQKKAQWAKGWDIRPSALNRLPFVRDKHEWLAPLMPYVFESLNLSDYDVILSVTSAEAKGVLTHTHQLHLCYLLTPTRYLWSHTHDYLNTKIKKICMSPFISSLRRYDFVAASRPDYIIPISEIVAERCRKYYRREPEMVVYPPVNTTFFRHHPDKCYTPLRDYYLVVSRPVQYKRTQLVIDTFRLLPQDKLVIVGEAKKQQVASNIFSVGQVDDQALACYYHHAKALIFPQEEDFGITAVEAQAAGKPVIAYNKGGAAEIVKNGQTGIFFSMADVDHLSDAIKTSKTKNWYDKQIRENSLRFSESRFQHLLQETVEGLWEKHQKLT